MEKPKYTVADYLSCLLFARTQAHAFHWLTKSNSKHLALEVFYDTLGEKLDTLAESHIAIYGPISLSNNYKINNTEDGILLYFTSLLEKVKEGRELFEDSDQQNIVDEITTLVKGTLYKLKRLS